MCHSEERGDIRFTPLWAVTSDTGMARVTLQPRRHSFPPSRTGDLRDVGARGCGAAMSGAHGPVGPWCCAGWVKPQTGQTHLFALQGQAGRSGADSAVPMQGWQRGTGALGDLCPGEGQLPGTLRDGITPMRRSRARPLKHSSQRMLHAFPGTGSS